MKPTTFVRISTMVLHNLEAMTGTSLIAADGEIGSVANFFFNDQSWMIRYAVVDVRSWLSRHDVLIAVAALEQPDWAKKTFRVHLTKEQVRHSPDIDSNKPVSRQQEIAMSEYYGWPSYWEDDRNTEFPLVSGPVGRYFPVHTGEDPHLRSVEAVTGYTVCGTDGDVGRLEDVIVDENSWHIGFLDVKAGDWLHDRSVLIPTGWVREISWANHRVNLNHPKGL